MRLILNIHINAHVIRSLTKETLTTLVKGVVPTMSQFPRLKKSSHELTKSEFCLIVLHLMNKVDSRHLAITSSLFELLDVDASGTLDGTDLADLLPTLPTDREVQIQKELKRSERRWFKFNSGSSPPPSPSYPDNNSFTVTIDHVGISGDDNNPNNNAGKTTEEVQSQESQLHDALRDSDSTECVRVEARGRHKGLRSSVRLGKPLLQED